MKIKLVLLAVFLMGFSSIGHADKVWLFKDVTIEDVTFMNSVDNTAVVIKLSDVVIDNPNYSHSCDATNSRMVVGYWYSSTSSFMQSLLSAALSAQAQGLKVDINVDPAACSNGTHWWDGEAPHGIGLKLFGIKVAGG